MSDIKIAFDEELTHEGITFEKKAAYGLPKKGQWFMSDQGFPVKSTQDFAFLYRPILTPKKKKYTVIKVEGESLYPNVYHRFNGYNVDDRVVSVQVVEE